MKRFNANAFDIAINAARNLAEAQPTLITLAGNAYTHRRMATRLCIMESIRFSNSALNWLIEMHPRAKQGQISSSNH